MHSSSSAAPGIDFAATAHHLSSAWRQGSHLDTLPTRHRPASRADGYAAQQHFAADIGQPVVGWKIAATSTAGQQHIHVSGPLAGPIFAHRLQRDGASVSLATNRMRVAECEIVFTLGQDLEPRPRPWTRAEVLAAVTSVHPGIEVPDSRFIAFEQAGEAQLIADCACMNDMVLGAPVAPDARVDALPDLVVHARVSDGRTPQGTGRNVLGDPVEALVWLVNELNGSGRTLQAGQFVTTGALVPPIPVLPGQRVEADFGWIGTIAADFT